ncbi:MAG TPA: protein translocase subunit SecD [Candidatus Paceibacterota bacterium]|nr:protein translocase subunit SecD [Candidatus Paceibacterota bacterium]
MSKKKLYITIFFIFLMAVLAGIFSYPNYFNRQIDSFNNLNVSVFGLQVQAPHFPNIPFILGLDLQGGVQLIYEADLSDIEDKDKTETMEGLRDVIERRVNLYGVAEPVIQVQGESRLIVELAGVKDIRGAIEMIGETPYLEFREILSPEEKEEAKNSFTDEEISQIIDTYKQQSGKDITKEEVLDILTGSMLKPTELTGKYLKRADITFDSNTNKPQVSLQFKEEGAQLFEQITERNVGKPLAIFLDGQSIVDTDGDGKITDNDIYAPVVQEKITGGKAVITGDMNVDKAREIVKRLNSGALPVKIGSPIYQKLIGPTLGQVSLEKSLKAGIFGFLAIILFMIIFYRLPGVLASVALVIYAVFVLFLFKIIPVTLTLAGIGGFILSVGMAVDANILIFSRMREELKEEKDFDQSVKEGFDRAWPSIRDSNFNSLIVCLILFTFATSFIKGFAFTLILGILVSMFSAIIITRTFLRCFIRTRLEKIKWLW